MTKVLRVINRFNLGGPTYNAAYLTRYMGDDFETLLIGGRRTHEEEDSFHITEKLGIKPIIIPEMTRAINLSQDRQAYQKIAQLIDWFKPDIVHTHASKAGALGRQAAYNKRVKTIVHTFHGNVFHSYFNYAISQAYIRIERNMARKSSKIIAISPLQKKELVEVFKVVEEEKVEVVPLGFDLKKFELNQDQKRASFRSEYGLDNDCIAIGIIGRLVSIKNHTMFIDLIKQVTQLTSKQVVFFIIGDGEEKEKLKNYAREQGIDYAENSKQNTPLLFTSWIKDIDIAIAGLDIIAMTSLNEGTPVSLIEAQAGNKPIVTTDVGGIRDIVIPNKTALVSKTMDKDHFLKNLLLLIEDANKRHEMGKAGFEFVKERFTYTRLAQNMVKLYRSICP